MQATTAAPMPDITVPDLTFGSLYAEHHPEVLAYFLRRFDRDTAVDCAAEVFTVAWRRIDALPQGEGAIRWLYGVCRNVARNQERSRRRLGRLAAKLGRLPGEPPTPPDVEVVRHADEARVVEALHRLRSRDQEILRLATWEELPHADIAEILGISRHAVDQRIRRAAARLRVEFEKGEPR